MFTPPCHSLKICRDMKPFLALSRHISSLIWLLAVAIPSFCPAADTPPGLTVKESGTPLYSRQDVESDKFGKLQKGETLIPVGEAVGQETWYMVKTQGGLFGWVRAAEVSGAERLKESFKQEAPSTSTWSARSASGRALQGTWTADRGSSADKVSGSWTLRDGTDKVVLSGTWLAQKFSTGWSGMWRAAAEGQRREYAGSWTADFSEAREASILDLFSAAARNAIRGVWSGGNDSGSWTIRAAN
jgi:hypothetical protein